MSSSVAMACLLCRSDHITNKGSYSLPPLPSSPPPKVCRAEMSKSDIIQVPDSQPTTAAAEAAAAASPPSHSLGDAPEAPAPAAPTGCTGSTGESNGGSKVGGGGGGWIGSTKLGRLEFELREMRRKSPGAKAVVFSQVTGEGETKERRNLIPSWVFISCSTRQSSFRVLIFQTIARASS